MLTETSNPIFKTAEELAHMSVSERIRYRLVGANCRYHANDNISAFIEDGELDELKDEVGLKMQEVLRSLVIDTEIPNIERLNELMIVGPITVRSACSHHLCPILGQLWIGLLPNEHSNLIGLSKYARLCEWIMTRPQIQEEAVTRLANVLEQRVKPDGLAIVMEADHLCMQWRGVKDNDSRMMNSVMRGSFLKDPNLRREFLSLLSRSTQRTGT
jgi:GTP cyclohydrolase I